MTNSNKKDTELKVHAVEDIHVSDFARIEIRILGYGQPYFEATHELKSKFKQEGVILDVPTLISNVTSAHVLITIKKIVKGLVTSALVVMLIDKFIDIQCAEPQKSQTVIKVYIEQTNNFYTLPQDTTRVKEELKKLDEEPKGKKRRKAK